MTDPAVVQAVASRVLAAREVAHQARLPRYLADNAEVYVHVHDLTGELVVGIRAFVLTEPAGEVARGARTVAWQEIQRPRWLPRRVWRRLARVERRETVHLAVEPRWTYPHADLPRLGDPVRQVELYRGGL